MIMFDKKNHTFYVQKHHNKDWMTEPAGLVWADGVSFGNQKA